MSTFVSHESFCKSYINSLSYPENICGAGVRAHKSTLRRYRQVLDSIEDELCHPVGHSDIALPIRDLYGPGKDVSKRNIKNEQQLEEWLGVRIDGTLGNDNSLMLIQKDQPKCRFIYLFGETSRSRLRLSRKMLTQLFTFHQVMPAYLDFVFVFGRQGVPRDFHFGGFRETIRVASGHSAQGSSAESSLSFDMCFNLKGVTMKRNLLISNAETVNVTRLCNGKDVFMTTQADAGFEWSIRTAAIYHKFDAVSGSTVWIVTKGGLDIQERYKDLTVKDAPAEGRSFGTPFECFRSSIAAHLMFCQWATEDWRSYLGWLEGVVDEESIMAILGPRGSGTAHKEYKPSDIQQIHCQKERVARVATSLRLNIAVIGSLRRFYERLARHKSFPLKEEIEDETEDFLTALDEILGEFAMYLARTEQLEVVIKDRKEMILQHLQSQSAEKTERLSHSMERETIVMRIITSVTLLYLPATFVSTFFSTDVVKFQSGGSNAGNSSFSVLALNRWLQVTIPLTLLTICGSWLAYRLSENARGTVRQREQERPLSIETDMMEPLCRTSTITSTIPWRRNSRKSWSMKEKETV